jgi:chromosome segregation ATPase
MGFIAVSGIIMILVLLAVLFLIPTKIKGKKKKKKQPQELTPQEEEFKGKISRLEKHIHSLRDEILTFQKEEKVHEKALAIEKAKVKKFQEKLSQEREWHEKEQNTIDKKGKEFQQIKQELLKVQENFSSEHSANLRLNNELKEMKQQNDTLNEKRRAAEGENAQLNAKLENNRREIALLKKENAGLAKKKEDLSWIAKPEYERVLTLLKEKEKELERVSRNSQM